MYVEEYQNKQYKPIVIVIISYNACHFMEENIKSIRAVLPESTYRIVVVDNASTDGVTEYLEELDDVILIKNEVNVGFGPACNQAVKITEETELGDCDVFLLNNDARLTDKALELLRNELYSADDIGAVGAISNYAGNMQQIEIEFDRAEQYIEYAKSYNTSGVKETEERVRLSGFAMLVRRELWDDIGGFDEDFVPGYFEDDALSMEILKRGFKLKLVKGCFIYHAGSQSFAKTNDYNELLDEHRELFVKKYGFDIIKYAYGNKTILNSINKNYAESFNVLELECGLGANLRLIRSKFPASTVIGVESREALKSITENTIPTFSNITELLNVLYDKDDKGEYVITPVFDVLIMNENTKNLLDKEVLGVLVKMCKSDVYLFYTNETYENYPFDKIKLIAWDMDDTFWRGTLSEGDVDVSSVNIELIKRLTDSGIVNTISSKNDEEPVINELKKYGIDELFVFNNINWNEKGSQLMSKIKDMGLRTENVLFIDDNPRNLEEVKSACPGIMTELPGIIPYLCTYYSEKIPKDLKHNRLNQYKLLEKKNNARSKFNNNEQFLYESNIKVIINRNCLDEIDRITELVARTNQLNYTKNRDDKELLIRYVTNDWNDCGYVKVKDRFGDYGIVGFYCYNKHEKSMEHFLFSCRVLGMGVEQYVYNMIGCPDFKINEPVALMLYKDKEIPWITEDIESEIMEDVTKNSRVRILLKGPCDMSAIEPYLNGGSITVEFNYVNEYGFVTTGHNHTMHIWESATMSENEIDDIVNEVPFITKGDFETKLFSEEYHIICLSLLEDLATGLYRNKETGAYISFESRNFDLTSPELKSRFLSKEIGAHGFEFTDEIIDSFSGKWEFIGNTPLDLLFRNLDYIYENVKGKPLIILLLGSEIDYEGENEEFAGLGDVYRELNPIMEEYAADHERIRIINPTRFIHSQKDYVDCINHFSRNVYYEIAGEICEFINEAVDRIKKNDQIASNKIYMNGKHSEKYVDRFSNERINNYIKRARNCIDINSRSVYDEFVLGYNDKNPVCSDVSNIIEQLKECKSRSNAKLEFLIRNSIDIWEIPLLIDAISDKYLIRIEKSISESGQSFYKYIITLNVIEDANGSEINKTIRKPRRVVAMTEGSRAWRNVELVKECGMIPYMFNRLFGCEVIFVGAKGDDVYEYLSLMPDIKMHFLKDGANETKVEYIRNNAKDIDLLILRGAYPTNHDMAVEYKRCNPFGKIYMGLDANSEWMDRIIWYNSNYSEMMECVDVKSVSGAAMQKHLNIKWPWHIDCVRTGFYKFGSSDPDIGTVIRHKEKIILTVARLGIWEKANEVLMEAFARISDDIQEWKVKLVGPIDESFKPYIEEYYRRYPELKDRVLFTGAIFDREKLHNEYLKASVFSITSRTEGFPNVIAEALNTGCAIAITKIDGYADAIADNTVFDDNRQCGLAADIDDVPGYANILKKICMKSELNTYQNNAYYIWNKYFNYEKTVRELYGKLFG